MNRAGGLSPLVGHEELRERIRDAARAGRIPQSLLLHGPAGVGKQRLGLWMAALLQCSGPSPKPCGECRSCKLSRRLEHPDVHWHFPLPRARASSPRKLREKLEETRLEELERRRKEPLEPPSADGPTGIYLAAVEEIRSQAARRPAMGPRSIYLVGDAEQMVPQAANPEAANAFLKLLEEPPEHASLILTSSRPGSLLPTIRSRALSIRVPPLDGDTVEAFLREEAGLDPDAAARAARLAQGSIGRGLRLAAGQGAEERRLAARMLGAALSSRNSDRLRIAAGFSARGARGEFSQVLQSLDELLRDLMTEGLGHGDLTLSPELVRRASRGGIPDATAVARATRHVERAAGAARGNINPQALAAVLLADLHRTLRGG